MEAAATPGFRHVGWRRDRHGRKVDCLICILQSERRTDSMSSIALRADQVRCLGPVADLKAAYCLLGNPIRFGYAPMQAQMVEPGVGEKGLDEATLVGRVLVNAPVVSAVPASLARVLTDRMQKRHPVFWVNAVFHRYQNRASVCFDGVSRDRVRPLH